MTISSPKQTLQNLLDFRAAVSAAPLKLLCLAGALTLTPSFALAQDAPDSYWTQFVPSTDTRLVFVSSTRGNDSNTGLNPNSPVKTLAKGYALLRDGHPDWMLLKRGDVWNEPLPRWNKSGRSESEMMIAGAYGDDPARPQIRPEGGSKAINIIGSTAIEHVAFVGMHLEPRTRADDQAGTGILLLKSSDNILFEDLYITGFKDNFNLQAFNGSTVEDITINGCISVDAWSLAGHSQGLFASGINGLTIENSVFDSNGFSESRNAEPTIYNHNIYIQTGNQNVVVRGNIIADGSSHGIQLRSGGIIEDNLFVRNPIAILVGGGTHPTEGGVAGEVQRNLVMYGRDIDPEQPRGWGIDITNVNQALVAGNILYSSVNTINVFAINLRDYRSDSFGLTNVLVEDNTIVGWHGGINIGAPGAQSVYENIRIEDNTIFRDLNDSNKSLMYVWDLDHESVSIEGNHYNYIGMNPGPFRDGTLDMNVESWESTVDSSGLYNPIDTLPGGLGLDAYLTYLGRSGNADDFMTMARNLSRQNTDPDIRPYAVYTWHLEQLAN